MEYVTQYQPKVRLPVMAEYRPHMGTIEDRLGFKDLGRKREVLANNLPIIPKIPTCNF